MKCVITGDTRGVGKLITSYFKNNGFEVIGFNRGNFFDISQKDDADFILHEAKNCDVFVNNAHHRTGQIYLLENIIQAWKTDSSKTIINLSSRFTTIIDDDYCAAKRAQDDLVKKYLYTAKCRIINLKPGLIDIDTTKHKKEKKMSADDFIRVFDMVYNEKIKIQEITFGL